LILPSSSSFLGDTPRAVQKCRHTETAEKSGSAAIGGELGIAALEAFGHVQGEGMALN